MGMETRMKALLEQGGAAPSQQFGVTIGTVVDTNDPQQMGRLRVICAQWGDSWDSIVEDLPWALYVAPFGGKMEVGTRGPGIQESQGAVAYGMWAIPKVGAQVVVFCADGNPMTRMWFGCLYDQFTPHTMPHGRFMYDDHPELEKSGASPFPQGPYTSSEKLIQPLANNLKQQFGNKDEPNYEYRSRGADYQAARVDVDQLGQTYSKVQDDRDTKHDGWTSTQGYQASRTDPFAPSSLTDKNYDSLAYSITTPGFHSFSMDDRQENCRVRIRTVSGNQVIIDDTNERIYIATAKGNNWIELDQDGNIDMYTSNKVNIRAAKDINLTSDETIRMYAKKGIHMHSDDVVNVTALKDINVRTETNIRARTGEATYLQTGTTLHIKTTDSTYVESDASINVKAADTINIQSGSTTNVKAGADANIQAVAAANIKASTTNVEASGVLSLKGGPSINQTGGNIYLNDSDGPAESASSADPADAATPPNEKPALFVNRVPDHEPWARTMTKADDTLEPEFDYTSDQVNRSERGRTIERGMYWRR